jgi:hypothetical protein
MHPKESKRRSGAEAWPKKINSAATTPLNIVEASGWEARPITKLGEARSERVENRLVAHT